MSNRRILHFTIKERKRLHAHLCCLEDQQLVIYFHETHLSYPVGWMLALYNRMS
jgi:hypothetical protein